MLNLQEVRSPPLSLIRSFVRSYLFSPKCNLFEIFLDGEITFFFFVSLCIFVFMFSSVFLFIKNRSKFVYDSCSVYATDISLKSSLGVFSFDQGGLCL